MEFIAGVIFIANFFLAIVAGLIAATLFEITRGKKLSPWKPLAWALILFAIEEILKTLIALGLYVNAWITHIVPSLIAILLIYAIAMQIHILSAGDKK